MKARTRFLRSVISAAKTDTTEMPWTRGALRRAHVAARQEAQSQVADLQALKRA